jgi:ABC-type sugar transport system substrate-binding protein
MMQARKTIMSYRTAAVAVVLLAVAGLASAAVAQDRRTPKGWSYELRDGKPVPKGNRVTNADGSWREVIRQGSCTTIKEKTASGEYRETRECTPK